MRQGDGRPKRRPALMTRKTTSNQAGLLLACFLGTRSRQIRTDEKNNRLDSDEREFGLALTDLASLMDGARRGTMLPPLAWQTSSQTWPHLDGRQQIMLHVHFRSFQTGPAKSNLANLARLKTTRSRGALELDRPMQRTGCTGKLASWKLAIFNIALGGRRAPSSSRSSGQDSAHVESN